MKTAIIKGLFGSYDFWADPRFIEDDVDYHVFTDQKIKSKVYEVHDVNRRPKVERHIKIKPWEYLPGYDKYIWIDANIHPRAHMIKLPDADIVCLEHPARNCVYEEHKACLERKKDDPVIMQKQMNKYRSEGYPENAGMVQTGFLARTVSDQVLEHASIWWDEVAMYSRRDQLSFNYALAKTKNKPTVYAIQWNSFEQTFKLTAHKR